MENELDDVIHSKILKLCADADALVEKGDYRKAVTLYKEAWDLIPDTKSNWNASTWILTALGDAYLFNKDYDYACDTLEYALKCPGGLGNPYIHLRLGQGYYEQNLLDKASDNLARAYMGGGKDIFQDQAGKYIDFLKSKMKDIV